MFKKSYFKTKIRNIHKIKYKNNYNTKKGQEQQEQLRKSEVKNNV